MCLSARLCCLLGNMCHGVLPLLTRPSAGRTQAVLDVPLLPFLADVSAVTLVVVTETIPESWVLERGCQATRGCISELPTLFQRYHL